MFLQKSDLKNNIYEYQVEDITEGDDAIVYQALQAAEDECRSYLAANNKKEWQDGRLKYDLDKIFTMNKKRLVEAFSGQSNIGKTTAIVKVASILNDQGFKVCIIKHDPKDKAMFDTPGKDSFKF